MEMTKEQIATWLAGLIDGEGHISVSQTDVAIYAEVGVSNTCLELIEAIKERVGFGNIRKTGSSKSIKQCYIWSVTARDEVKAVLDLVSPYLIVKRQRQEIARMILESFGESIGQARDYNYRQTEEYQRGLLLRLRLVEIWRTSFSQEIS